MADFLTKAQKQNEEMIEVLGETVIVRGLSIGELVGLTKPKKGQEPKDSLTLTSELIARCCFKSDGSSPLIPAEKAELLKSFSSSVFNALNEAVERVNGGSAGNSRATDTDGLPSA